MHVMKLRILRWWGSPGLFRGGKNNIITGVLMREREAGEPESEEL